MARERKAFERLTVARQHSGEEAKHWRRAGREVLEQGLLAVDELARREMEAGPSAET